MWRFATTCNLACLLLLLGSCRQTSDQYATLVEGSISYPFADQTRPIGKDANSERFVKEADLFGIGFLEFLGFLQLGLLKTGAFIIDRIGSTAAGFGRLRGEKFRCQKQASAEKPECKTHGAGPPG